jgi:phosphate-selective porin OprO/OprP
VHRSRTLSHPLLLAATLVAPLAAQETPPRTTEERLTDLEQRLEKSAGGDTMRVFWKDGLRFESADKRYKVKLGGRIHYDGQFFDADDDTKAAIETGTTRIEDGTEFRRLRYELSGEVGDRVEWALATDFGGGTTNFRNAYAGVKDLPFGNVRAGQFKEPYGLEQITSSNNITFTERSLMNAFVPAFNAGVMVFDTAADERMTWAVGGFRTASDSGEVSRGDGEYAGTARITGLPVYSEDGRDYVHVGLGYSRRSPTNDGVTFASRPEANLAPTYVTTTVAAEDLDLIGAELAWTTGPLTLSGEYTLASISGDSGAAPEPDFSGYYLQAAYLLTGESRGYRKAQGCFEAVKPAENAFGEDHGIGAWELAARLSSIDLVDDGVDGGELDDLTFGVNWYLNANTRLMLDYILADLDAAGGAGEGDTNIFAFRWQFAF